MGLDPWLSGFPSALQLRDQLLFAAKHRAPHAEGIGSGCWVNAWEAAQDACFVGLRGFSNLEGRLGRFPQHFKAVMPFEAR